MLHVQQTDLADIDAVRAAPSQAPLWMNALPMILMVALGLLVVRMPSSIVDELHVLDGEVAALRADAGAIMVGHPGALQGQVADRDVVAVDDQKGLALAGGVGQHRARRGTLDRQIVLPDDAQS